MKYDDCLNDLEFYDNDKANSLLSETECVLLLTI